MKKFNINESIYITITEHGFRHLQQKLGNDYIDNCIMPNRYLIDGAIYYKLQCYEVFRLFPLTLGGDLMFGTNILIPDFNMVGGADDIFAHRFPVSASTPRAFEFCQDIIK